MSDAAFKTAAFPGYTTAQLVGFIAKAKADGFYEGCEHYSKMDAEIDRRSRVEAGDTSVMTSGERLRFLKTGKAA